MERLVSITGMYARMAAVGNSTREAGDEKAI